MTKHTAILVAGLLLAVSSSATADGLSSSALGNSGEIYTLQAGPYGELFPGGDEAEAGQSVLVLDVLRPAADAERLIVPATLGAEKESSPRLLYSKQSGSLNVVWESRLENEASLLLAHFDGDTWSAIEELYFDPDGVLPELATTSDALHLEASDGTVLDLERQTLHLAWRQIEDGRLTVGYMPILFLNGDFIGWKETFTFRHLNGDANAAKGSRLPATLLMQAHADRDSVSLTFGSSAGGRVTTLEVGLTPMELVHLGDQIHDLVMEMGFDPADVAGFAGELGIEIVGVGARGRGRSRLTLSVVDYVAAGVATRVLDVGRGYTADQTDLLADDLRAYALDLTSSLLAPAPVVSALGARSRTAGENTPGKASPIFEIDVGGVLDDTATAPTAHVLELRSAVEWSLPDAGGATLTLFTSDDGLDLVAGWLDADGKKVWYVESTPDLSWSAPKTFELGGQVTLEKAIALLQLRVR